MSFAHYPITWLNSAPLILVIALLLDRILGEPSHWHPLVGFGHLTNQLEKRCNLSAHPLIGRLLGLAAWLLVISPFIVFSYFITHLTIGNLELGWVADCLLLYFAIGARSLKEHALRIYRALLSKDLAKARLGVSMIVSRDTQNLSESEIATATVESVLENGNDAIFGAIVWFLLLGGTGAVLFRLANTLDAMWGYRTPRFIYFGWAAARLDDLLNLIPARLTALSYALCGHTKQALQCWHTQARTWYSPNAGPVMSAGAGALNVRLGGTAIYHGEIKARPTLGIGEQAQPRHIASAIKLVEHSMLLWCVITICIYMGLIYLGLVYPGLIHLGPGAYSA